MNHAEKLLEIYGNSSTLDEINLPQGVSVSLATIGKKIQSQKGAYTVLLTLGVHKLLFPKQDIRYFQDNMDGGFSARTLDAKYITPTLKGLKLTSMSESGWLTRSLEQPYPYTKDYNGKISKVKKEFLDVVDFIQNGNEEEITGVLRTLLNHAINIRVLNKVEVRMIENPESVTIGVAMSLLSEFIGTNYKIGGGSKLPVIAFYTVYNILVNEMKRYKDCELQELGSHTSSDRTSKAAGDIQVNKDDEVFEVLEIKYGIEIDAHLINRVIEKIYKHNPKRYYILTTEGIKEGDAKEIVKMINKLREEHGCQLIINGLLPTMKYYLRLISDLHSFLSDFTDNILADDELKIVHKETWAALMEKAFPPPPK